MDTKLENSLNHIALHVAIIPQFVFNNYIEFSGEITSPEKIAELLYEKCNQFIKIHEEKYLKMCSSSVMVKYIGHVKPMTPGCVAYEFRVFKLSKN
jgi:hypothetical protein